MPNKPQLGSRIPEEILQRHLFWGKFQSDDDRSLSLVCHSIDVALVFRALCDLPGFRRSLNESAGTPLENGQLDRLGVLAMLHDAGKANLGFQFKVFENLIQAGHIRELAPLLDLEVCDDDLRQAFVEALPEEIVGWFEDETAAYSYLLAIFSHHGRPLKFRGETTGNYWLARKKWWRPQGRWDPMAAIKDLSRWSRIVFPFAFEFDGPSLPTKPRFHHRFAGLLMLADWLGSHSLWFPIEEVDPKTRLTHGRTIIPTMLRVLGLHVEAMKQDLDQRLPSFVDRFDFDPRPLQAAVDALDTNIPESRLVIAESETGSGKTEAALNWFFKLFSAGKVDSLYFALPTRVAARELYHRVKQTVERWFPEPSNRPVTVLAVPGYAQVDGIAADQFLPGADDANQWHDDQTLLLRERQWAAEHPKRFLAATVAVGTIDQALLSSIQTAHAHLRSVCLDRGLLVVDEVHASDLYMTRLLESLLEHHLSVEGYAILLSATLGAKARQRFVSAAGGEGSIPPLSQAQQAPYPSVTLADGKSLVMDEPSSSEKEVQFEVAPWSFELDLIVDRIAEALESNARVLVVMNTVERVNQVLRRFEARNVGLQNCIFSCNGTVCPHHGRFAPHDRRAMDAEVSKRFGKGSPSGPILLVGTQTLEQSLDIDADYLITDLAPADVLLQRVGRLHRHCRSRPFPFRSPRCVVLIPPVDFCDAIDERGGVESVFRSLGFGSVYDLRALELTRRVLARNPVIRIPSDNRMLVESVTHPEALATLQGEKWELHAQVVEGEELAEAVAASNARAVYDHYFGNFEFNELGGRVVVRLGADSLQMSLSQPFVSPLGQEINEIVLPGHLAPEDPVEQMVVESTTDGVTKLSCGDRRYTYSRFGLEALTS